MPKKFGPASIPTQKINSIKPIFSASVSNVKPALPNNKAVSRTPIELPSVILAKRILPILKPTARTTNSNKISFWCRRAATSMFTTDFRNNGKIKVG